MKKPAEKNGVLGYSGEENTAMRLDSPAIAKVDCYELLTKLWVGSFGVVYGARVPKTGVLVTLQVLHSDQGHVAGGIEAVREHVERVARLNHSSIADVKHLIPVENVDRAAQSNLGIRKGDYFLVSEYPGGITLGSWRRSFPDGIIPLETVLVFMKLAAEALDYAHKNRVLHRDLNPENILIVKEGQAIKMLGFALGDDSTGRAQNARNSNYASPEQLQGRSVTAQSDQYSLAVLLWEMLTGEIPVGAPQANDMEDTLSLGQNAVMHQALADATESRYPSCKKFYEALSGTTAVKVSKKKWIGICSFAAAGIFILLSIAGIIFAIMSNTAGSLGGCGTLQLTTTPFALISALNKETGEVVDLGTADTKGFLEFDLLEGGIHVLTISQNDFVSQTCEVEIEKDEVSIIELLLAGKVGSAIINSEVPAAIFEQGKQLGSTGQKILELLPGKHEFEIVTEGYEARKLTLDVPPNGEARGDAGAFVPIDGTLALTITVPDYAAHLFKEGSVIKVNDTEYTLKGTSLQVEHLSFGEHVVLVTNPNFQSVKTVLNIKKQGTTPLKIELVPNTAFLTVKVNASNARMKLGKEVVRVTEKACEVPSLRSIELIIGAPEYMSKRITVAKMTPGEKRTITVILKEKFGPKVGRSFSIPLAEGINMEFMSVKPGAFRMGSPDGDKDEQPLHKVSVTKPYWIGRTEVTQAQYEALMDENPSRFKGADLPVEQIGWDDALVFCHKFSELSYQNGTLPREFALDLPTEVQWEYACRAGSKQGFASDVDSICWYGENSDRRSHPVASKQANTWGIHDMHGNVWEWCLDDWHATYEGAPRTERRWGHGKAATRVRRGGSWITTSADGCTASFRRGFMADYASHDLGFRLVIRKK